MMSQSWFPMIDALGWTLLHFLWQGVAVGLIYLALRPAFSSVLGRYRLGMTMLLVLGACPLLTLAMVWPSQETVSSGSVLLGSVDVMAAPMITAASRWHLQALLPWLVFVWVVGVCIIAARAFFHWRRLKWLVHYASAPLPECREMLARLCGRFGLRRPVQLLASFRVGTPMLIGWLKPVILLPASMLSGFTPHQIELIVAHELGHVRRWDYLANLFQVILETVLFYHPVVHWISRDVRDARESCCDDLVLTLAGGSPVVYARTLADLEELRHEGGIAAPALGATGGVLLTRIRRIVGVQRDFYEPIPRNNSLLIILIIAAGALIAGLRLHSATPAAALLPSPTQTLALLSGNPMLAQPLHVEPIIATLPAIAAPAIAPISQLSTETTPLVSESAAIDKVARPRIAVSVPSFAINSVRNIGVERIATTIPVSGESIEESSPQTVTVTSANASTAPAILHSVQPHYPQREMESGETANVALEFNIEADGSVSHIQVVGTRAPTAFQDSAIAALNEWRFAASSSIDSTRRYKETFAFTRAGMDTCHEVIGSHICRSIPNRK